MLYVTYLVLFLSVCSFHIVETSAINLESWCTSEQLTLSGFTPAMGDLKTL